MNLDDKIDYQATEDLLKDRVILITGAGDGIGKALAFECGRYGATVILLGKTQKKLEQVYDTMIEAGFSTPAIFPMDLMKCTPNDHTQLAHAIHQNYGRLDGLLLNAAILGESSPIDHYDPMIWDRVMKINVTSYFLMTQNMLPLLRLSEDASLVFTSSSVGRQGRAFWGAYAVSKFATEGLMQIVADENENNPNFRANSVNPGATRTSMRAQAFPGEDPNTLPTPEQISNIYLYLLGPDSRGMTGHAFNAQKKKPT